MALKERRAPGAEPCRQHTQLYSPSKAATIKNKQNKEKEAK